MHTLAPHLEKRVTFRTMTRHYARGTLRDLYGIIEYYRSLSLDWWFINLKRGLQLRCGRRELDETTDRPFLFVSFLNRDVMLRRTTCGDYAGAPYCPHDQLLGPDTLASIRRHNRAPGELPAILRPRGPRPGHMPDSYTHQAGKACHLPAYPAT